MAAAVGWFFAALIYYTGRVVYAWRRKRKYALVFHGSHLRRMLQDPDGREEICEAFEKLDSKTPAVWDYKGHTYCVSVY